MAESAASVVAPTCGSRREVLERRPLHHGVGVAHHKHLVEHRVVVDETLDHAGRLDVVQVFLAEDDGHLRIGRRNGGSTGSVGVETIWPARHRCRFLRLGTVSAPLVQMFEQKSVVRVRGSAAAGASYLMGVGSVSHPCFANWRVHKGEGEAKRN